MNTKLDVNCPPSSGLHGYPLGDFLVSYNSQIDKIENYLQGKPEERRLIFSDLANWFYYIGILDALFFSWFCLS